MIDKQGSKFMFSFPLWCISHVLIFIQNIITEVKTNKCLSEEFKERKRPEKKKNDQRNSS